MLRYNEDVLLLVIPMITYSDIGSGHGWVQDHRLGHGSNN